MERVAVPSNPDISVLTGLLYLRIPRPYPLSLQLPNKSLRCWASSQAFFAVRAVQNSHKRASNVCFPCKRKESERGERKRALLKGPIEVAMETWKTLERPVMVVIMVGLLIMGNPIAALAASGGRMGGKAFSSGRTSGSYSSRTFSVPSYSSSAFSFSVPYSAPSPFDFGGGFFVRPAYGIGFGAGSSFFQLVLFMVAAFSLYGFISNKSNSGLFVSSPKTSVLKLQVGLLGLARSLQRDLERIAESSDTSVPEGLNYVLTETVLALLRHPDYCISGYSLVSMKRSIEDGEKRFNQLSIEERGKFDEETLVNVNNMRKQINPSRRSDVFNNEYIVVTILVAAEGEHSLPIINSSADLMEALRKLGSIPSHQTLAVEVLWTPQNESDALSERELLQDYPLLRPL
eukprot:TRINITY_DN35777_c0_g1_i1.p1 TRINITY_DN35777_c0_g1~~TRINITY_DN35777_c0_g1_i1.p1  ORF type:complete len:403 (+),score=79.49 TRINITY_DN35777_c0_g1_i1:273-1481(+)